MTMRDPTVNEWRHHVERRGGLDVHVIEVPLEFISDRDLEEFERLVKRNLHEGTQIRVDCRRVQHINSTALGAIISAYTRAQQLGGAVKLDASGNTYVRGLLKRTRLDMLEDSDEGPAT